MTDTQAVKSRRRFLLKVAVWVIVFANLAMASVFLFHEFFNFTSSNSALYFLKGKKGGIEVSRDLLFEDADRLIFMLDANCVFNYFMRGIAVAKGKPVLELTWDAKEGIGDIKQFRTDGTILALSFSRFKEDAGTPRGLFLGGDLPYGDTSRSKDSSSSGFGYYDGKEWSHIWCAANEGLNVSGTEGVILPALWKYKGSRVLKNTSDDVILESEHEAIVQETVIGMKRWIHFVAGKDYFLMRVRLINPGVLPLTYSYAYGDEPWVGRYDKASRGDVGWNDAGLIQTERFLSPVRHKYAGYWDNGNEAAGEGREFTGYANFIEWISPVPSFVYLSNDFNSCCAETRPLDSASNRVINIAWINQILLPGDRKDHVFAVGMARADAKTGFPVKPDVDASEVSPR